MPLVLVGGSTQTATIDGISAAGADRAAMAHTPAADFEIVAFGRPVRSPVVPVSPTGCPTPAVVTRAVRELLGFETVFVDAGLAGPTAVPVRRTSAAPGGDIREAKPVPRAERIVESARSTGRSIAGEADGEPIVVGESIPGGTTTALGVLAALGERPTVSSSLPENPIALKRSVVERGLAASDLEGEAVADPVTAIERMGDPVLATVTGLVAGAIAAGGTVTLAGGTQLATAGALLRHAGVDDPLTLTTTSYVAGDESAELRALAADHGLDLVVADPGFRPGSHPATDAYLNGVAKDGVGMGGAVAMFDRSGGSTGNLQSRVETLTDSLSDRTPPVTS